MLNKGDKFDDLISKQGYGSRSEAIRDLVRRQLSEERLQCPKARAVAAVRALPRNTVDHLRSVVPHCKQQARVRGGNGGINCTSPQQRHRTPDEPSAATPAPPAGCSASGGFA